MRPRKPAKKYTQKYCGTNQESTLPKKNKRKTTFEAIEALGTSLIITHSNRYSSKTPWFRHEVKDVGKNKKPPQGYEQYKHLHTATPISYETRANIPNPH